MDAESTVPAYAIHVGRSMQAALEICFSNVRPYRCTTLAQECSLGALFFLKERSVRGERRFLAAIVDRECDLVADVLAGGLLLGARRLGRRRSSPAWQSAPATRWLLRIPTRGDQVIPRSVAPRTAGEQASPDVVDMRRVALDLGSRADAGLADEVNDGLVVDYRVASPVLDDVAHQSMLDLVPLRGTGRKVRNADDEPGAIDEGL